MNDNLAENQVSSSSSLSSQGKVSRVHQKALYTSNWIERNHLNFDKKEMVASLRLACDWLINCCMCPVEQISPEENSYGYKYSNWVGASREYVVGTKQWDVFGPIWHTGQLVKALVLAHKVLGQKDLLAGAQRGADFILHTRIDNPDDPDFGAINAQENGNPPFSATSCMLESLDGLIYLSEHTKQSHYWQAVIDCLEWAEKKLFLSEEGLFLDDFDFDKRQGLSAPNTLLHNVPGRPLLDDGVFLKAYQKSGNYAFQECFFKVADRLLEQEYPPGNWVKFPPCDQVAELIHPRQAFWWARPMIMGYQESGQHKYMDCAVRAGHWYKNAQRLDGGMFRLTDFNFNTTTYGHATSGILSGACLWHDLIVAGKGDEFRNSFKRAIKFGHSMQFVKVSDKNLKGAILEKVLEPNGTDQSPYNVRDLGTIFYVQALAMALMDKLL